uniref:GTD-binding domain-containing protein n=1 Tax=Kalanchoe fedtschenkoi TaxID=63787 RepID=A0A7N0V043_KALFE
MASRTIMQYVEQEWGIFPHFVIFAILEWIMIFILFIDGILAFIATLFAKSFGLPAPCVFCTRFDTICVRKRTGFCYNESACDIHRKEISHLAYCHVHKKLSDIRRMCEGCLLSFATEKESDCDTYKSLVGLLQKDAATLLEDEMPKFVRPRRRAEDGSHAGFYQCSCCGSRLKAKLAHSKATDGADSKRKLLRQVSRLAKAPLPSPRTPFKPSMKEEMDTLELPHIKYMELKLNAANEDEYASNATISGKEDAKAAAMPLLTESDDLNDTPTFSKGNKFFGIPLTDSASSSPKWGTNRTLRKSPFEKSEISSDLADGNTAMDDIILHHLKRQVRLDRKSLIDMYMELDEERSASAVAANNAMAMITRLQAEKAAIQMEALQYQRLMEEQAEYDQENFQAMKDLVTKKEEEIKGLEVELDIYRERYGFISDEDVRERQEQQAGSRYQQLKCDSFSERSESVRSSQSISQEAEDGHS